MRVDLHSVATAKFLPARGIVAEPFPQRGAGRDVPDPLIDGSVHFPDDRAATAGRSISECHLPRRGARNARLSLTLSAVIFLLISVALSGKLRRD